MNHRRVVAALALTVCMIVSVQISHAQAKKSATRIRFKSGDSTATVDGQLGRRLRQFFLVSARKGQELQISVEGRNESVNQPFLIYVEDPLGKSMAAKGNESLISLLLTKTGDYRIQVGLPHYLEGSAQEFRIRVRIQ